MTLACLAAVLVDHYQTHRLARFLITRRLELRISRYSLFSSSSLLSSSLFNISQEHFTHTAQTNKHTHTHTHKDSLQNPFIRDEAHYHSQLDAELPISKCFCANQRRCANAYKRSRYDTRSDRKCCSGCFFCPLLGVGDFRTTATWLW